MTAVRIKTPEGTLSDPFPDVVRIEPAGFCNFHCHHCPVGREGGRRGVLSSAEFKILFDRLPLIPRVLVLYHGGEPLLNYFIEDMIQYSKDKGVCKLVMNTNASKINCDLDLSGVDDLRVSFDGNSPEQNDAIREGGEFKWNARRVRALAQSDKRPKQITIYNINDRGRVADYLLDFFAGYSVSFRSDKLKHWPRLGDECEIASGVTYCPDLWETFTILTDGSVTLCCEDLLGEAAQWNAFDEYPLQIWGEMQVIRDAFEAGNYPEFCKGCWRMNET
jgi:sulfatase maturation enzyme AslB (radical SAM superfamily)